MDNERRVSLRKSFEQTITIKVEHEGKSQRVPAHIVDVSPTGARIRSSANMEPGDTVEFFSADDPGHPIRYLVAWTGRLGSDLEGEAGLRIIT